MVRVWAQTLGVASVDTRTTFFDLGGHSLLLLKLLRAVNDEFGMKAGTGAPVPGTHGGEADARHKR